MPCSATRRSVSSGDHRSISTTPHPALRGMASEKASGAAWYSGPVHRWQRPAGRVAEQGPDARRRRHLGTVHALGPARRARRVEHRPAELRVVDVGPVLGGHGLVVGLEPVDGAADRQAHRGLRGTLGGGRRHLGEAGVGHEHPGLAVADDVGGLVGREVPVDRRHPQSGPLGRGDDLGELGAVRHHQRHGVAGHDAAPAPAPAPGGWRWRSARRRCGRRAGDRMAGTSGCWRAQ